MFRIFTMSINNRLFIFAIYGLMAFATLANSQELDQSFYVPADPDYTIVDSMRDSVNFTLNKTLTHCDCGNLASISSFVNPLAEIMHWHDFGDLEGPGWAANAVGGTWEIYCLGEFLGNQSMKEKSLEVLDHVLQHGFIQDDGLIRGYRNTQTKEFCLNYKSNSDWFCPGSMAKIAYQLLVFADTLKNDPRAKTIQEAALNCAQWIDNNVPTSPNGWYPRRCTPTGEIYKKTPEGVYDDFWQISADGLFIIQLNTALTERGLADLTKQIKAKCNTFIDAGGIFGSINHDTYDPHENVAYSVAFRTLLAVSRLLDDEEIRNFAYETCLVGLDQFKMKENRNGVKTKGLLYMEKSWNTAYLWENAEAALAYFEAALDLKDESPTKSKQYEQDGLVILRAISKHHYGPYGFLTEGVDWNNVVGQQHHINEEEFAAIKYTEPFLNNQHIVEPTLLYLEKMAKVKSDEEHKMWYDFENNLLMKHE